MTPTLPDNGKPMFKPIAEPLERNDDHFRDSTKIDDTPVKLVRVAQFYFKEKE